LASFPGASRAGRRPSSGPEVRLLREPGSLRREPGASRRQARTSLPSYAYACVLRHEIEVIAIDLFTRFDGSDVWAERYPGW
jgi:hypothetical protein